MSELSTTASVILDPGRPVRWDERMDVAAFARALGLEATLLEQNGVIRRDQALAAGLTRHQIDNLVKQDRWVRVLPAVYATTGAFGEIPATAAPPLRRLEPRARVRAVWLWAGKEAVIGGEAAAWWWSLTATSPTSITVIVPPHQGLTEQQWVRIIRARVDRRDARDEGWIRVTSPARTCLDLARSGAPDRVADALRLRKVDQAQLQASLDRGRRRPGQTRARTVVREAATNPWSEAERVAHRALRRARVTGWVANPRMRLTAGHPSRASGSPLGTRHPDIAFDDVKLAVEIDGRSTHDTADAFENDRTRHNEFVRAGWVVLHFTRDTVLRDPDAFVAEIVAVRVRLRRERGLAE